MRTQVAIVGGGIIGLATAYRLLEQVPDATVTVIEKEPGVGRHQSSPNSGVLHCGLYYKPGSRRARLAVRGIRQMIEFHQTHDIPHEVCGKVVVATAPDELPRIQALFERGQQNGLCGLRLLSPEELREIEPSVRGVAAIRVPEEGIADYPRVCETLAAEIQQKGARLLTSSEVTGIRRENGGWRVMHTGGDLGCEKIVTCAGLHSDRVASMSGACSVMKSLLFRTSSMLCALRT